MQLLLLSLLAVNAIRSPSLGGDPKTWSPNITAAPTVDSAEETDRCDTCKTLVTNLNSLVHSHEMNIEQYLSDICPTKSCETISHDAIGIVEDILNDPEKLCIQLDMCEQDVYWFKRIKVLFV